MRLCFVLFLLGFVACSTNRKLDADELMTRKGIAMGHVDVMFNGLDATSRCSLFFVQDKMDQRYDLDSTGFVVFKAVRGKIIFNKIVCVEDNAPYVHFFKGAEFYNYGKATKTYFGHISVNWVVDVKKSTSWWNTLFGGGRLTEVNKSEGMARFFVRKDVKTVSDEFERMNGDLPALGTRVMLIKEGRSL